MSFISGKKLSLFAAVFTAFAMQSALAESTDTGQITFKGKVLDTTCKVTVDGKAGLTQEITLADVSKSLHDNNGHPFAIAFTGCEADKNIEVAFSGFTNENFLANTDASGATNVGIGLFKDDGTTAVTTAALPVTATGDNGQASATLNLVAKYQKVDADQAIGAGAVQAVASVSVTYK